MSNSLQPHGLYNPWNSPGKNTGVGSLSLLWGSWTHFPHCRHILHQLSHKGSPRISLIESNNFLSPSSPFTLLSWIDHVSSAPTMVFWTTCTLHLLTVFRKKKIYDPFLPIFQHSYSIFSSVLLNYACSNEKHLSSINVFKMWSSSILQYILADIFLFIYHFVV